LGGQSTPQRELRTTVTIVFRDLTGSTALAERLDPESLQAVMTRYFDRMRRVIERHGGTVEKFIGDAVMAVFGVPVVHEDDAVRAVRAAAEMEQALTALNREIQQRWGVTVQARTGVNTGEVMALVRAGADVVVSGDAVNVAARLEQVARPGEILVGAPTYRLVRDAVRAEPVTPLRLRGKAAPVAAWRLLDVAADVPGHRRRMDAPMVDREQEFALLERAYERAITEQGCLLLTLLGAAGVGKSRLVAGFLAKVGRRATVLRGRCLSYGEGITFWPVAEVLRQASRFAGGETREEARAKLAALLEGERQAELIAERIGGVLGLADATAAEEIPWAVRKVFEALARRQPLIVVFDDLHWAEPTFLDLVEHVAEWSRDARLLLICIARPEVLEARPQWGLNSPRATSILLEPLTATESEQLVSNLLSTRLAEEAQARIIEAAEGNPLFMEEFLGMLIDDGLLTRSEDRWVLTTDPSAIPVPASIQTLLVTRLDQLNEEERTLVERASVVGQVFQRDAVAELSHIADRPAVDRSLTALVRKGLIGPARSDFVRHDAFRFRHLLIRDAAYQTLPKALRAELHERFAVWQERTAGGRIGEYQELLAYHLEQAYRYRAELGPVDDRGRGLARSAADRLADAGRRVLALGDMPGAAKLLQRAVELLPADAPGRPELLVDLGAALLETGAAEQGDVVLAEATAVAVVDDARRNWRITLDCSWLRLLPGRERRTTEEVRQEAERAIEVLTELGDDAGIARAWLLLSEVHNVWGRLAEMAQAAEHAVDHARRAGDLPKVDLALSRLAVALAHGPMPVEEAIRRGQELLAQTRGRRRWEAGALRTLARLEAKRGRFADARALLAEGRAIVEELGLLFDMAGFAWASAQIEVLMGRPLAAEQDLRLAYDLFGRIGDKGHRSTVVSELAETLHLLGRDQEARRLTEEGEAMAEPDDLIAQIAWRKARARLLAEPDGDPHAEWLAKEAVALAERTDIVEAHGDALMSLGEVLHRTGRADPAVPVFERALALYARKGNVIRAGHVRDALAALRP
jgi:class 3 adenylate cyclase/tetratricopeptide (TPR) repeat protein